MTETESEERKPSRAQEGSNKAACPEARDGGAAVDSTSQPAAKHETPTAAGAMGPSPPNSKQLTEPHSQPRVQARQENAAARPPSSHQTRSNSSLSSSSSLGHQRRQQQPPRTPQHSSYADPHYGQQMLMSSPGQGHYYPPGGYGQMYGHMQMGLPQGPQSLMYTHQPPYMMPHGQWPHAGLPPYHPVMPMHLSPEQYPQPGYHPAMGLGHHQAVHGGFFPPGYEDHYGGGGEPHWNMQPLMERHNGYHPAGQHAPAWNPEELHGFARQPRVHSAAAGPLNPMQPEHSLSNHEHARGGEDGPPGHRRQLSTSSSERTKGHRRMVSVPVDFPAASPEAADQTSREPPEPKPAAPARRHGHRRQSSLPTATDMERLRDGSTRRGRHTRSNSWMSNGRTSTVLEEFKMSQDPDRKWTLTDVKDHIVEFCKDQTGSRFIQQALEDPETTPEQVREVALEAKPRFAALIEDVFGNYVIQKLLERAAPSEKVWMAERICKDSQKANQPNRAVALSRHQYGCRVVQKALETLDLESKKNIMEQLLESTLDLVADQNGNHVIQKCVECIKPTSHIEPLINELLSGKESKTIPSLRGAVVPLSQHTYGCRVVQRVLEHCDERSFKQRFMAEILKDVLQLSKNIYSNYVIQHVLEYGEPQEKDKVLRDLSPCVMELSRDKFASNVVERCLKYGSPAQRRLIIQEFLQNEAALVAMMKDDYGNYVCFSAFEFAEGDQKQQLAEVIKKSVGQVRRTSFGKNFHSKLAEKHPSYFGGADFGSHNGLRGPSARPNAAQQTRFRLQSGRSQPPPVPVVPTMPSRLHSHVAPRTLPSNSSPRGEQQKGADGSQTPSKAEDSVKFPTGQVSVMADGANPPVHPPMHLAASHHDAGPSEAKPEKPPSRTTSQDATFAGTPAALSIEG